MSWTKRNIVPKKLFKIGQSIEVIITEIDKEKRRIAISHKLTLDNPYQVFQEKYPEGSIVSGVLEFE